MPSSLRERTKQSGDATGKGTRKTLSYDRLVVATGSRLFRPNIPGLAEHGFSVDSLDDAVSLDKRLHNLAGRPAVNGRDTVVVAGGGFTGIEAATEMPTRLRKILGKSAIAPDMGEGPRPIIEDALRKVGVETRLGADVASLDESGVTLSSGEHIETETVIWAAGIRAAPLTQQIPAERDNFGRLLVDRDLRVPGVQGVFATGDAARAACDDEGNYALMSCQHATRMAPSPATTPPPNSWVCRPSPITRRPTSLVSTSAKPRAVHARLGAQGGDDRGSRQEDQARDQHRLDLSAAPRRAAALASADPEHVTDV